MFSRHVYSFLDTEKEKINAKQLIVFEDITTNMPYIQNVIPLPFVKIDTIKNKIYKQVSNQLK